MNNLPPDFLKNINNIRKTVNQTRNIQQELISKINEPYVNLQKSLLKTQTVRPYIYSIDLPSIQKSIQPSIDAINNVTKYLANNQQSIRNAVAIANKYSNFVEYVSSQYTEDELQSMELDEFLDIAESDDMLKSYNNYLQSNKDNMIVDIINAAQQDYINSLNDIMITDLLPKPYLQTTAQKLSLVLDKAEKSYAYTKLLSYTEVVKRTMLSQVFSMLVEPQVAFAVAIILFVLFDLIISEIESYSDKHNNNEDTDK